MGQYYKPVFLDTERKEVQEYAYSHHCDNGLKLMEHSYLQNDFVNAVVNHLKSIGGANLCWAGDYADCEKKKVDKAHGKEIWRNLVTAGETEVGFETFWRSNDGRLFTNDEDSINLYGLADGAPEIPYDTGNPDVRYIVNESKKEYVDLWRLPQCNGWTIHPLPLLTSEGNGRGGGDYEGLGMKYVGTWARDFIVVLSTEDWKEIDGYIKDGYGYQEIKPNFVESYNISSDLSDMNELVRQAKDEGIFDRNKDLVLSIREQAQAILALLPKGKGK